MATCQQKKGGLPVELGMHLQALPDEGHLIIRIRPMYNSAAEEQHVHLMYKTSLRRKNDAPASSQHGHCVVRTSGLWINCCANNDWITRLHDNKMWSSVYLYVYKCMHSKLRNDKRVCKKNSSSSTTHSEMLRSSTLSKVADMNKRSAECHLLLRCTSCRLACFEFAAEFSFVFTAAGAGAYLHSTGAARLPTSYKAAVSACHLFRVLRKVTATAILAGCFELIPRKLL